jgi:hypothetical protein
MKNFEQSKTKSLNMVAFGGGGYVNTTTLAGINAASSYKPSNSNSYTSSYNAAVAGAANGAVAGFTRGVVVCAPTAVTGVGYVACVAANTIGTAGIGAGVAVAAQAAKR